MRFEKISDIMKTNYQTPDCQRKMEEDRISVMKEKIIEKFSPITPIYFCLWNKERYVIDGQHRLEVYSKIKELYNKKIPIIEIAIDGKKEIYEYFLMINDQLPLPDVYREEQDKKEIILETYDYFIKKYPNTFKYGTGIKRNWPKPYIRPDIFMQQITYLIGDTEDYNIYENYNIRNSQEYIDILENLNQKYSEQSGDFFTQTTNTPNENYLKKIKKKKMLYFGMSPKNWMENIVMFPLKMPESNGEEKITQALRQACWVKWMGKNYDPKCWCCHVNEVTPFHFEAGHVKARAVGGKNTVDNLRPICGFCNKAMGTKNMLQFMKEMNYAIPE